MLNAHTRRAYAALTAYNALADMGARPVINGSRYNTDARFDHTPDLGPLAVVWSDGTPMPPNDLSRWIAGER